MVESKFKIGDTIYATDIKDSDKLHFQIFKGVVTGLSIAKDALFGDTKTISVKLDNRGVTFSQECCFKTMQSLITEIKKWDKENEQ